MRVGQPAPNATIGGHKSAYKAEWGGKMQFILSFIATLFVAVPRKETL